jgi:hypothetical protein
MSDTPQAPTPDEQVYQENKDDTGLKVVYQTEHDRTPDHTEGRVDQDEISAESFPASDSPATTATVSGSAEPDAAANT